MSDYRRHIALIRSLCGGTEQFCEAFRGLTQPEEVAFLEFLREQQVSPWLSPIFDDDAAQESLPSTFLEPLRALNEKRHARTVSVIAQMRELQRGLLEREVEALFFKGIIWGSELYGDPFRRHQFDVDVMVDRSSLRAVIGLLGELGYDTRLDGNSGEELETRLSRMLGNRRGKLRGACSLKRGSQKIDLHSSLRIRFDSSVDFRTLMDGSRDIEVEGMTLRGPSLDAIMMIQLIVITDDLGRSACRAKLFLDLYLLCRDLGPGWSWEAFLEARCKQGLEKLTVNIWALFLDLWDAAEEFPELAAAIDRRADQLEIAGPTDADAILARPRHDRANKRFAKRIYPGGTPGAVALAILPDLPHVTARAIGLRRSQYCFSSR